MRLRDSRLLLLALTCVSAVLSACSSSSQEAPNTLHVLAGSELSDVAAMSSDIQAKTGITLKFDYVGTLTGAEEIASGGASGHELAWFSSTNYLSLLPGGRGKLGVSTRIMQSPVVLGVKHSVAEQLGWSDNSNVTWADIASAAASGKFHFGMTNPSASNSGFSALVGVATALSGASGALTGQDINATQLTGFFSGLGLTAGSSGFLADQYVRNQSAVDGIINYESVLLSLNSGGQLRDKLDLVYPKDGIITADYPLVLLDSSKRDLYDKLVAYLTSADEQRRLMTQTNRRPVTAGVALDSRFPQQLLIELPFPGTVDVIDTLLEQYLDAFTKPSHTVYVLDLSGSMAGGRLSELKQAFNVLTDPNATGTERFARFRSREEVTIITFSGSVLAQREFTIQDANQPSQVDPIRNYVNAFRTYDGTAIYDAMAAAYQVADAARAAEPDHFVSVVLMTDGENNEGISSDTFLQRIKSLQHQDIPAFPILFGEGDVQQLTQIATVTGGKLFNSTQASLATTFEEIRGYQ
ncbi:MAG: VWA domain-containing protein [Candidatus Dormibacteria bacterium]